ncbi:MAG: S46 family peptidase [Aureispira sp.]|nr:S46 family peptidase [Aureispira sp.]
MKKMILLLALMLSTSIASFAIEGMWIPSLIDMFYSDMKTYGLKLKPQDIYSTNKSSLKDAIVQFNGGCTAEIVSDQGLLLTNHHCGMGAIRQHSSVEKDYLKNGFWAKNKEEELACTWMRVTFVKEIRDVTKEVFEGITDETSDSERRQIMAKNMKALQEKASTSESIQAKVKPFNMGNQYYMLITEDFNDIRLVGAPPSAIGKFGGDTDNWVWPRHTGDFAVFRIYANKDNKSAKHSEDNKPFKPAHYLPISMKKKKKGDFTMVYGFPGHTDQHYSSDKLKFYIEEERPARIKMRQTALDIISPAMNESDEIRLKYASKQASIANAWKKWIGQIGGLKELRAIDKKLKWEKEYTDKANSKPEWKEKYGKVIADLNATQAEYQQYEFARAMYIEYLYSSGLEAISYAYGFYDLALRYDGLVQDNKVEETAKKALGKAKGFFKDYDKGIDHKIFKAITPILIKKLPAELLPENFAANWEALGEKIFTSSVLLDAEKLEKLLTDFDEAKSKQLSEDPAIKMVQQMYSHYFGKINPKARAQSKKETELMKTFVEGILTMFPKRKTWADANSTLRIAYGKIDGSTPRDGMQYLHYTTIDGIMQKYDPNNPDFQLTDRFLELYKKGDFGDYTQNGKLWVCFTASNHTTGGNSGSPVIDAKGRLMGINFDRSWESTMSDFMFDESRCRNIVVDIRYVLWVIDKYGDAKHLVDEMTLAK